MRRNGRDEGAIPWLNVMPGVFVLLWSTGFIGARLGMPYAEPLTFLLIRFALVIVLLTTAALLTRAPWPRRPAEIGRLAIIGVLVHACYLGGVFSAIHWGVPAAVAALLVGLQPLTTAVAARFYLGEVVRPRQWLGLAIGLVGVVLVVWHKLALGRADGLGIAACAVALAGMTLGTIYQKKHAGGMHLLTGSVTQFVGAGLALLPLALLGETMAVRWTGEFIFAVVWLTVVLSIGAISLLYLMIRHGAAAKVASLFFLTPSVTAVLAFLIFGETLGPGSILGFALTGVGVWLVTRAR